MAKTRDELAYCGNDCEGCAIYRAMVFGEEMSPDVIRRWQEDFNKFLGLDSVNPKNLNCHGCRNKGEEVFYAFKVCPIRKCCITREISSCGLCPEFKICKIHDVPEGRKNLERIAEMG
jgi:hypothetical protein